MLKKVWNHFCVEWTCKVIYVSYKDFFTLLSNTIEKFQEEENIYN